MNDSTIRARPSKAVAAALLEAAALPSSDLTDEHMEHFFFCGSPGAPTGLVGIELCGTSALLRSLVVQPDRRSTGLGQALVEHAEAQARARGAQAVYLLTTTAAKFFERRGYVAASRASAPAEIRATREFADICPASSAFMVKRLEHPYSVLFLCTGNSARSILAEALLNHWGQGRFRSFSAGSHPKDRVHPIAIELLRHMQLPTDSLASKSWDVFATPGAPHLDFVFTVCDNAAGETCPVWPGQPMTAHWGVADPAAVEGTDAERWAAFRQTFAELEARIRTFASLPIRSLDRIKLQEHLDAIGDS